MIVHRIYILARRDAWVACMPSGFYRSPSLDSEGFIHSSKADQLTRVANTHFPNRDDMQLLHIDPELVHAEIRWEPAAGSLYPHVYGPLNLDAVVAVTPVFRDPDGRFRIDPASLT